MAKVTIEGIVITSIITAFTIAAALIWKDVIIDIIKLIVSPGEELFFKFVAAVFATLILIIAIYVILKTEREAEIFIKKLKVKKQKA